MKEFLMGVLTAAFAGGGYIAIRHTLRARMTFRTKHGQRIYDMGVPRIVGYTLSKAAIEQAEDIFIQIASKLIEPDLIRACFYNNKIIYHTYPIPDPSSPTGFVCGRFTPHGLIIGLQPFVDKTALVHEWMHDVIAAHRGGADCDPDHLLCDMWENGVVGEINAALAKTRLI